MGKRPWKTFHILEVSLFILHYVEMLGGSQPQQSWTWSHPASG